MSVHQCPKCELRFALRTELEYHCREEHPGFRHDYAGPWQHPEDKLDRDRADTPPTPR